MATPATIDIEELLQPISEESPTGEDLRADDSYDSVYFAMRSARDTARSAEKRVVEMDEAAGTPPEWSTVADLAADALRTRTKDLAVASWYTEALLRTEGLAGLRDGLRLIHGLVERYWDGLYPEEDEDGVETKVAPVTGLSGEGSEGTLITPLKMLPITLPNTMDPLSTYHYQQAREVESIDDPAQRQAKIDAGRVSMQEMEVAVRETPPEVLATLMEDAEQALQAANDLYSIFDDTCGRDAPTTTKLRQALTDVRDAMAAMIRRCGVVLPTAQSEGVEAMEDGEAPAAGAAQQGAVAGAAVSGVAVSAPAGAITNREEAFKALGKLAEFFRRTEPHSPISYTLDELVRRGRLPLQRLLEELIPDDEARRGFLMRSGIEPPSSDAGSQDGY
ncbi:MAG: type VI secretion system protein TssA [Rhodospirillaceae bacterium]|nr:type VI secretion system protein TssA [Rhodospirillaceae bacterium]